MSLIGVKNYKWQTEKLWAMLTGYPEISTEEVQRMGQLVPSPFFF